MPSPKDPVTCTKCGIKDYNKPGHVGTSKRMHCVDCAGSDGKATLCRNCCPTNHGCKWST